jgi:hypothetical protein
MSSSQQIINVEGIDRESYASLLRLNPIGASPPTSTYITPDNTISILTTASLPSVVITLTARILLPDGTISLNQYSLSVPGGNVPIQKEWSVPEGFLLTLCVYSNTVSGSRWAFVQVLLLQTSQQPRLATSALCSGFPTRSTPISFPSGVNVNNLDCVGNVRPVTGTIPAGGNYAAQAVPPNVRWRLIGIYFTFTTSAVVSNRALFIRFIQSAAVTFTLLINTADQPAGTNWFYQVGAGLSHVASVEQAFACAPLPTWQIFNQGDEIDIIPRSSDVGDLFTVITYLVEEWVCP